MLMIAADYRKSLRARRPRVFVNGTAVESVADEPLLRPGVDAVGITYDFAHAAEHRAIMTARQGTSGKIVNRMLHIDETSTDLLCSSRPFGLFAGCRAARSAISPMTP